MMLENLFESEKAKLATPSPPLGVVTIYLPLFFRQDTHGYATHGIDEKGLT